MPETSKLAEGRANRNTHVSYRALSALPLWLLKKAEQRARLRVDCPSPSDYHKAD